MSEKRVQIQLTIELDLEANAVWPDGPPPANWGAADVMREIAKSGSLGAFLSDWNADASGAEVDVWVQMDHARGYLA